MTLKEKLATAKLDTELFSSFSREDMSVGNIMADISFAILSERKKRGLSQKDFAKLMGVSQGMVSKWEGCAFNFTIQKTVSIFSKLGLDVEFKVKKANTEIFMIDPTLFRIKTNANNAEYIAEAV